MTKLAATAVDVGIVLRKYHGAGTLAEALLDMHRIDAYCEDASTRPPALISAVDRAFFGGCFATSVVGIVPELHCFDIASAYPAAMVSLPCLAHGHWIHHGG
jgi:hypothetical protein